MEQERRRAKRVKKIIFVQYSLNQQVWDQSNAEDISEIGMQLNLAAQFSPGQILSFRLRLPSNPLERLEFKGRVVASKEQEDLKGIYTTRIEFTDLEPAQQEAIRQYITWVLLSHQ